MSKNRTQSIAICSAHGSLFCRHRAGSFVIGRSNARGVRKIPCSAVEALAREGYLTITITAAGRRARLTPQGEALALAINTERAGKFARAAS